MTALPFRGLSNARNGQWACPRLNFARVISGPSYQTPALPSNDAAVGKKYPAKASPTGRFFLAKSPEK